MFHLEENVCIYNFTDKKGVSFCLFTVYFLLKCETNIVSYNSIKLKGIKYLKDFNIYHLFSKLLT